ncbi:MAG: hypothetical protein HYT31_02395 [Parcubacteria group bacterium]|nr:hypothetical protein [Parcubacteria group bacterium]
MKSRILIIALLLSAASAVAVPASAQDRLPNERAGDAAQGAEEVQQGIPAVLQVPLPFVPENPDLSQYIAGVYRLLIGLAAVFAVVMLIIAGYQWIMSGGGSDKISSAKKRIFGAAIGLMLALLSYVFLNAITPRLVALRLPDVSPVTPLFSNIGGRLCNTQEVEDLIVKEFGAEYTTDAGAGLLAELAPDGRVVAGKSLIPFSEADDKTVCGRDYKIGELRSEQAICGGVACVDDSGESLPESCINRQCRPVYLQGNISWSLFTNTYADKITVYSVCNETDYLAFQGYLREIDSKEVTRSRAYSFSSEKFVLADPYTASRGRDKLLDAFTKRYCSGGSGGLKGFVLEIEVNDSSSLGPTLDDNFALGKSSSGANKCNGFPLYLQDGAVRKYDFDDIDWSGVSGAQLFQPEDFANGTVCDLEIDSSKFPLN